MKMLLDRSAARYLLCAPRRKPGPVRHLLTRRRPPTLFRYVVDMLCCEAFNFLLSALTPALVLVLWWYVLYLQYTLS